MEWIKKHKILTVVLVIVALGIIGGATAEQPPKVENNQPVETKKKEADTVPGIGQPVRDGKFEFTVKSVQCEVTSVGTAPYLTKTPQGQYCLLFLSVKNVGNEAQSLFADNQYLFNAAGQKFSADSQATSYAAPDGSTWYSEINPGNSVEGLVVFDLPKDQHPVIVELHDSTFSGGVKVAL